MTDEQIKSIRERLAAARASEEGGRFVNGESHAEPVKEFYEHSICDVAALLDEVERLRVCLAYVDGQGFLSSYLAPGIDGSSKENREAVYPILEAAMKASKERD